MGESEAYYRLIPALHLADSNIGTLFVHTGFNKSRFLRKITVEETKKTDTRRLINLDDNPDSFYIEASSILDKYIKRPGILDCMCSANLLSAI